MGDNAWWVTIWQVIQVTVWDWGEEKQNHILKISAPRKNPANSNREKKIYSALILVLCYDYLQSSSSAVFPSFSGSNLCGHFYYACQHSIWVSSKHDEIVTLFSSTNKICTSSQLAWCLLKMSVCWEGEHENLSWIQHLIPQSAFCSIYALLWVSLWLWEGADVCDIYRVFV